SRFEGQAAGSNLAPPTRAVVPDAKDGDVDEAPALRHKPTNQTGYMAVPSFSFRITPCLISVFRRLSDCFFFKNRLISEGRIPGCALIKESVFSRSLSWPCFTDVTDRVFSLLF